jgi:hypothetical protein
MDKDASPLRDLVPMKDCIKGRIYRLRCRNLRVGVYDGNEGFIGIRTKFGDRFLFTEYHWEQGAPFGTVAGAIDMDLDVPDDIEIRCRIDTVDRTTGRSITWDRKVENPNKRVKGAMGWWCYVDTGEVAPTVDDGCKPTSVHNGKLFTFLEDIEAELPPEPTWERKQP